MVRRIAGLWRRVRWIPWRRDPLRGPWVEPSNAVTRAIYEPIERELRKPIEAVVAPPAAISEPVVAVAEPAVPAETRWAEFAETWFAEPEVVADAPGFEAEEQALEEAVAPLQADEAAASESGDEKKHPHRAA